MSPVHSMHHYNPDWLSDDDLVAGFIARSEEFTFLRNELARMPLQGSVQHYLLVGVRGSGKTTLLKRLAVAIRREADLSGHLVALSFPEELYQVKHLADFWWAACETLADELDRLKLGEQSKRLEKAIDVGKLATKKDDPLASDGLRLLLDTCAELQRRPVLLVDNLDLVFQRIGTSGRKRKNPHAPAYWALREALSTTTSPVVIGGSVRLSEPFTDYDKAFYDFFIPKRLGKLPLGEVRNVLERLAEARDLPEVRERLKTRPGRIEALHELTGGNPRALGLIFELLRQGPNSRAVEDFERLMDITTPYYKARFEDLAEQAQVVMHALAVCRTTGTGLRFGYTAAEIGVHAGLPTGTVSAQLDILEREGLVEKSAAHGRVQYRIAEQLFRLWLQMRGSRRIRRNVIGLTEFLEALFEPDELTKCLEKGGGGTDLARAHLAFAVADIGSDAFIRHGLLAHGAESALNHIWEQGGRMEEYLGKGDLPEGLETLVRFRDQLHRKGGGGLIDEEQEWLLGSVTLSLEEKETAINVLGSGGDSQEELKQLRVLYDRECWHLLHFGMLAEDLPLLFAKRARGLLPIPYLTPQDADSACLGERDCRAMIWRLVGTRKWIKFPNEEEAGQWLDWGLQYATEASSAEWANVAGTMRRNRCFASVRKILDQAQHRGESARYWYELGLLLLETSGDIVEAEQSFNKAIELDPKDAWPWSGLGNLSYKLDHLREAEDAYRKAIQLDPKAALPWYCLGILLAYKLDRLEEAEDAYGKAIELDPKDARPWNYLGNLLFYKLDRLKEAEDAYRKAIELDPEDALPWRNLGNLLSSKRQRWEEAEDAYKKAIELDPKDARPWNDLGDLLFDKLHRWEEAEDAYRKAIELDPEDALSWHNLGNLSGRLHRLKEAENAYKKAIELDPKDASIWLALANMLELQERQNEAVAAYVKSAILQPYWRRRHYSWQKDCLTNKVVQYLNAVDEKDLGEILNFLKEADFHILVSEEFVEGFLARQLTDKSRAQKLLNVLRAQGYGQHAWPLLLAFEAALRGLPEMLEELEPEVQNATRFLFNRLTVGSIDEKRAEG